MILLPLATGNYDEREAIAAGVNSTPTFKINGETVKGAQAFQDFKAIIDQELAKTTGASVNEGTNEESAE